MPGMVLCFRDFWVLFRKSFLLLFRTMEGQACSHETQQFLGVHKKRTAREHFPSLFRACHTWAPREPFREVPVGAPEEAVLLPSRALPFSCILTPRFPFFPLYISPLFPATSTFIFLSTRYFLPRLEHVLYPVKLRKF